MAPLFSCVDPHCSSKLYPLPYVILISVKGRVKILLRHSTDTFLEEIYHFVYASRMAYNSFVLYHNFRHAVDVLQSTFYFLLKNNLLPTYRHYDTPFTLSSQQSSQRRPPPGNPLSVLLDPFSSLVLLVAALGHDVGHPGVNNNFLVKLKSPLAQLYNDASVLESFHCAAYSQILRRYWPTVFHDVCVRKLMISSILATDMSLHNNYMEQMAGLTEKCEKENGIAGFTDKEIESMRTLICALMIKAADISNVVCLHLEFHTLVLRLSLS